ncbi:acyltransferase [Tissierella creatinini]|nr:acyltransferase [Tissierella creatinini]TJX61555.1 acyltransferase [Soehngenia saccharolytica]
MMIRLLKNLRGLIWINGICKSRFIPSKYRYILYKLGGIKTARAIIRANCLLDGDGENVEIGEGVRINLNTLINCRDKVTIGKNVSIAFGVSIITNTHEIGGKERRAGAHKILPVTIGEATWIGANATILPGVTIGEGCIIAAGSVVNKDCEPNGVYAGVPAKRIRDF